MSCQSEAHNHDHTHDHSHAHDLPSSDPNAGDKNSLYSKIDREHVRALNSAGGDEAGKNVIKPWDLREDESQHCESDADDSLIINIPFTAQIKLRSIILKTGPGGLTPESCHLYVNEPGLDFSSVSDRPAKEVVQLVPQRESVEYALRPSKFSAVTSIQLVFPNNISDGEEDTARIYYVGFKGEWNELTRNPDGIILYEAQANPSDHAKLREQVGGSQLGM